MLLKVVTRTLGSLLLEVAAVAAVNTLVQLATSDVYSKVTRTNNHNS